MPRILPPAGRPGHQLSRASLPVRASVEIVRDSVLRGVRTAARGARPRALLHAEQDVLHRPPERLTLSAVLEVGLWGAVCGSDMSGVGPDVAGVFRAAQVTPALPLKVALCRETLAECAARPIEDVAKCGTLSGPELAELIRTLRAQLEATSVALAAAEAEQLARHQLRGVA